MTHRLYSQVEVLVNSHVEECGIDEEKISREMAVLSDIVNEFADVAMTIIDLKETKKIIEHEVKDSACEELPVMVREVEVRLYM